MGRVYDVRPRGGERSGLGMRCHTADGGHLRATRVEFDDDADEGVATVTICVSDSDGKYVRTPGGREVCRATFRAWVRVAPKPKGDAETIDVTHLDSPASVVVRDVG